MLTRTQHQAMDSSSTASSMSGATTAVGSPPRRTREYSPCIHQQNALAASARAETLQSQIDKHETRIFALEDDKRTLQSYVETLNQTVQDLINVAREREGKMGEMARELGKMSSEKDAEIEKFKAMFAAAALEKKVVVKFEVSSP